VTRGVKPPIKMVVRITRANIEVYTTSTSPSI
jgi:hypothetical protein